MKPQRIQLSRRKGWRMPENTIKVDRGTKWGNPYRVGSCGCNGVPYSAKMAVELFRHYTAPELEDEGLLAELRGKNLACWCKPGDPCHADVLLELANRPGARKEEG